jgi:hypothetical protein
VHDSVLRWVGAQVAEFGLASGDVIEVGSYNVNGSVRTLFDGCATYLGIDHTEGPGVDRVADAETLVQQGWVPGVWDCVVSTEMLEHADRPWRAVEQMAIILKQHGSLLLTCRGFDERGSHGYHNPPDQWRFYGTAVKTMVHDAGLVIRELLADPQVPGWFVHAVKP